MTTEFSHIVTLAKACYVIKHNTRELERTSSCLCIYDIPGIWCELITYCKKQWYKQLNHTLVFTRGSLDIFKFLIGLFILIIIVYIKLVTRQFWFSELAVLFVDIYLQLWHWPARRRNLCMPSMPVF